MTFDLTAIRTHFPALSNPDVFLDNPGGTQICRSSMDRITHYFKHHNANHGGAFRTSRDSDAEVITVREAMADFLNAASPDEIIFGANMTTLTYTASRALGKMLKAGDTLVVTRLDHDANISPWLQLAEDRGCRIRWVDFHPEDGTLDMDDLAKALEEKPRIVAVGYASNALGTINPIRKIIELAHAVGALVYVDAVQYAPHGPIDVQDLDCDFLVCSSYKFFGPHLGILYGRYDLLNNLSAYRVRPAPADPPGKFETGTGNFEHMAGLLGTLEYLEWIGNTFGSEFVERYSGDYSGRRLTLKLAMSAIRAYEFDLSRRLLDGLTKSPGVRIFGPHDPNHLDQRVPTFSFTFNGRKPSQVAEALAKHGINVWDGNFYALAVTTRLDLEANGGLVRVGAVHYNTHEEVQHFIQALSVI